MFVPQVVLAITARRVVSGVGAAMVAAAGPAGRPGRELPLPCCCWSLSQVFSTTGAAYPILLCATGALGFGFGCTVPALNTFAARLDPGTAGPVGAHPERPSGHRDRVGAAVDRGVPRARGVVVAAGAGRRRVGRVHRGRGPHPTGRRPTTGSRAPRGRRGCRLPPRFWWYAAAVVAYGICETLFGNWSSVYLTGQRGLSAQTASLALPRSGRCVTIGRVIVAALTCEGPRHRGVPDPAGADRAVQRRRRRGRERSDRSACLRCRPVSLARRCCR